MLELLVETRASLLNYVWLSQNPGNIKYLAMEIKLKLIDQYKQYLYSCAVNSSKGCYYIMYKPLLILEPYVLILPYCIRIWLTRLRTSNHRLPIETGRQQNIPRDLRVCTLCNETICDEYHFLLVCKHLSQLRKSFLPNYYCNNPTIHKCICLMNCNYTPLLIKIAKFVKQGLLLF